MEDMILQYEKEFLNAKFCNNRINLENKFSKDFFEYGKSGCIYNREDSINSLVGLSEDRQIEISRFELTPLSEKTFLVHYMSYHKDDNAYALRTSIWIMENGCLKIFFHQGTPYRNGA